MNCEAVGLGVSIAIVVLALMLFSLAPPSLRWLDLVAEIKYQCSKKLLNYRKNALGKDAKCMREQRVELGRFFLLTKEYFSPRRGSLCKIRSL